MVRALHQHMFVELSLRWLVAVKAILQAKHSGFSQTYIIDNIDIIANFVFTYICSSLTYLKHMMLVNMKW